MRGRLALAYVTLAIASPALAQPADLPIPAATTAIYPPRVTVVATLTGPAYADAKGRTLYGLDLRTVLRWSPDPALFCRQACAETWEPLLAPPGSTPSVQYPRGNRAVVPAGFVAPESAPDWTIIAGPAGAQWVYKGWHMVYTRRGDKRGSSQFDGTEDRRWNTLKFVPPAPIIVAPPGIKPALADGNYVLTDAAGRTLFTGTCAGVCADWQPLLGAMASRGVGEWTVGAGQSGPQWQYRGKPVFVSSEDVPGRVPPRASVLRP